MSPLVKEGSMQDGQYSLEGKQVLVTGGAGFVGSHIVDQLVEHGCGRIIVIDNFLRGRAANLAGARRSGRVEVVEGDVRDQALLDRLVAGCDVVFHQAALRITQCAVETDQAMGVMVDATYNLLRLCVDHNVRKVIFASSASIYGMAQTFPTPESHHPYENRTLYGAAKSFGEQLHRSFADMYGLKYIALRYFNVYGPRMDIHGKYTEVMVRWMERMAAGMPPVIFGDGSQTMDLVHVEDVARANILAARSSASDSVYNVGTGTETSLSELCILLSRAMGAHVAPAHEPSRTVNPVPRRLAQTAHARLDLDFTASIELEAGLRGLAQWWRENSVPETEVDRLE
jgi:UDP-glucose 4-epimerase